MEHNVYDYIENLSKFVFSTHEINFYCGINVQTLRSYKIHENSLKQFEDVLQNILVSFEKYCLYNHYYEIFELRFLLEDILQELIIVFEN